MPNPPQRRVVPLGNKGAAALRWRLFAVGDGSHPIESHQPLAPPGRTNLEMIPDHGLAGVAFLPLHAAQLEPARMSTFRGIVNPGGRSSMTSRTSRATCL